MVCCTINSPHIFRAQQSKSAGECKCLAKFSARRKTKPYKTYGDSPRKFLKEPIKGTKILLCGLGWRCSSTPEVPIVKQHMISCHFLELNLKGTAIAHIVDLFRPNILWGTKTTFSAPKVPLLFLYGSFPWGLSWRCSNVENSWSAMPAVTLRQKIALLLFCLIHINNTFEDWVESISVCKNHTKLDNCVVGVQFANHKYDYRLNWTTQCSVTN